MLQIEKLSKCFNPGTVNERKAIDGLSLHLVPGDFVTVIGSNGAGKSSLMNLVAGVYPADTGKIRIGGSDVTDLAEYKRARLIGRVFQDPNLGTSGGMYLHENLALASRRGERLSLRWGLPRKDRELYRELLRELNLGLEDRLDSKVRLLSGGQRQALTLLMAVIKAPQILLLDEHTAALDPKTSELVLGLTRNMVENSNLTTLMITHNMKDALEMGNRLIMMDDGRIIFDVSGAEKKKLQVSDLLNIFRTISHKEYSQDRALLDS